MKDITIAIDGGAGVGKGTTAVGVAQALGYRYLDTGAMYRAVALFLLQEGIDISDTSLICQQLSKIALGFSALQADGKARILLNGHDVEEQVRTPEVTAIVSQVSSILCVRSFLLAQQQSIVQQGAIVVDGRDAGSKICPDAELKIHLVANLDVRAQRRYKQYQDLGKDINLESIKENLAHRDWLDLHGPDASSYIAEDARQIDTSDITIDQQVQQVVDRARELIG